MDGRDRDHGFLGLGLGLGLQEKSPKMDGIRKNKKRLLFLDLSISGDDCGAIDSISSLNVGGGDGMDQKIKNSCNVRFSNEEDIIMSSHDTKDIISRKKLRLNRDQTALLEESFRQHSTLNTAQKTSIAEKLNLRPRQVEVWFQNRRARTKLKQTEIDCEFLKKKCERLSEENRRLKKELYELRSTTINVEKSPLASSNLFVHRISKNASFSNMGGCDTTVSATIEEPKPNYHQTMA